ncbi:CPBP family intramembrane glutamic endopeptidase [Lactiplantibacillus dongliensis]|uniref:CPBP family intramembrane glutamic endopeptidase n=2 Tax=Lactiplantibacillus dongliensis TaxID=2559919 RepID=A0ABW1R2E1_9LACO
MQLPTLAAGYWDWWGENDQNVNSFWHWLALVVLTIVTFKVLWSVYQKNMTVVIQWPSIKGMLLAVSGIMLSILVMMLLAYLLTSGPETESRELITLIKGRLGLVTLICTNVVSPIMEEFFFRGIVQNFFSQWFNIGLAVTVTNLLFAFSHGYSGANLIGVFVIGCTLSWLTIKTNNLGTAIFGHVLNNWLITVINICLA